jgi:hypothetical protein
MSDQPLPKDKLGSVIAPGAVVALAISSYRDLKVARVTKVSSFTKKRWAGDGMVDYTAWEVTIQSRQHDWQKDTYKWGPERIASWQDMLVLHETIDDVEQKYSIRYNQTS